MTLPNYDVLSEQTLGEGGFLLIRRLRLQLAREDGTRSKVGIYDFVERPMGLDAVVVLLWHRQAEEIFVLLRDSVRIPLLYGRGGWPPAEPKITEAIAGILEKGEVDEPAIRARAVLEAFEEAGMRISEGALSALGPPLFPTPGMCGEKLHFVACEVPSTKQDAIPPGDGSLFEEGAELRWQLLSHALYACRQGEIVDMKTEIALRRLAEQLSISTPSR